MIHPTAIIHPRAQVDPSVRVGPYAVIDEHVVVGPDCHLGPHVHLTGRTVIGAGNRFFSGAVIGESPQDFKHKGDASGVRLGDHNTFREHVTVHGANSAGEETVIGSHNLLMVGSHVAHNCVLGNHLIITNGALLGGHVSVADRVIISGNCCVHQFVRIGTFALMQGGSCISKDLPPYTVARGGNGICGLNTIGLRRAGFPPAQRLELRKLYHALFRGRQNLGAARAAAEQQFTSEPARVLLEFIAASKRGVCRDHRVSVASAEEEE